jgi:hypothetical protein
MNASIRFVLPLLVLAVVLCALPVHAEEPMTLRHKFRPGTKMTYALEGSGKIKGRVAGRAKVKGTLRIITGTTTADGNATPLLLLPDVRTTIRVKMAGKELSDTRRERSMGHMIATPLGDCAEKEKAEGNPQASRALKAIRPDAWALVLPEKAVSIGESWTWKTRHMMAAIPLPGTATCTSTLDGIRTHKGRTLALITTVYVLKQSKLTATAKCVFNVTGGQLLGAVVTIAAEEKGAKLTATLSASIGQTTTPPARSIALVDAVTRALALTDEGKAAEGLNHLDTLSSRSLDKACIAGLKDIKAKLRNLARQSPETKRK